MRPTGLQVVLTGAVLAAGSLLGASQAAAQRCLRHRATTCNRCSLPPEDYALYAQRVSASVVAIASVDQPSTVTHYYLGNTQGETTRQALSVLRKDFSVLQDSLVADGVTLERIGVALYGTGLYAGTGLLRFDGGPDGSLLGANVVVRVRAYSGAPQHPGALTNMRLLWETERPMWVHRGEAKSISLLPEPPPTWGNGAVARVRVCESGPHPLTEMICQHFDETTHLEIVLERCKDR